MTLTRSTSSAVRLRVLVTVTVVLLTGCTTHPAKSEVSESSVGKASTVAAPIALLNRAVSTGHSPRHSGGRVRAYGDSVMLGAKSTLRHRLHAIVKAGESLQAPAVLSLVNRDRVRGRIHGPVVIHTGTNGTISKTELNRTVRKVQRTHRVILINVRAPRSWTAGNNRVIKSLASKYRQVKLMDWHKLAGRHPSWTYSDGIHLTPSGQIGYTKGIAHELKR